MTAYVAERPAAPATAPAPEPAASPDWAQIARELADDLAVDAAERESAGRPPFDELARIRESGLLSALSTGALPWPDAARTVRRIAAADSSLAELLARHHALAALLPEGALPEGALLAGDLGPDPYRTRTGAPDTLTLTDDDRGYTLGGRAPAVPGALVAGRLLLPARHAGTRSSRLLVLLDPAHPAVTLDPVRPGLGQRLTGAAAPTVDRLQVTDAEVLGPVQERPEESWAALALRLALVQVLLGTAEGALDEARDTTLIAPHGLADPDPYGEDSGGPSPDTLQAYGELAAAAHLAHTAAESAGRTLAEAPTCGNDTAGALAFTVAAAETAADEAALRITAQVLELADAPGLDRFWRNARTLTAPRSPARRHRALGEHFLYSRT